MKKPGPYSKKSLLLLLVPAVAMLVACSDPNARETPGEKAEWSVLQSVEVQNRAVPTIKPIVKVLNEYEILGVRGLNGKNVWILLNPKAPPFYKQLPTGNYEVPEELVERLVREQRVSYTVEQVLASHVSAK